MNMDSVHSGDRIFLVFFFKSFFTAESRKSFIEIRLFFFFYDIFVPRQLLLLESFLK